MRLTFLGKESNPSESPTLYSSDQDSYVVQGWKVTDREVMKKLDIPSGETIVEVPAALFKHLVNDGVTGVVSTWTHPIVHVMPNGNFIVQGKTVNDAETRGQMRIPDHEDCVEVSKASIKALLEETAHGSGHG